MRRPQATSRWAYVPLTLLVVIGLGCHRERSAYMLGHGTVESEDEVPLHAPSRLGGPLGGAKLHGWSDRETPDMKMDINTMHDDDFVDYLSHLEYDTHAKKSHLVDADCIHGPNSSNQCSANEAATMFIEPEIGAHLKKMPGPGSHGFIVARIINYDPSDRTSTGIEFRPHTRYWWVVNYNQQTGKPQSLFVSRTYDATNPLDTVPGTFGYVDCGHKNPHYKRAEAKFGTCKGFLPSAVAARPIPALPPAPATGLAEYIHPVSFRTAMPRRDRLMTQALTGGWISCPTGCCATQ